MQIIKNNAYLLPRLIMTLFLIQLTWIGETSTCYHVKPTINTKLRVFQYKILNSLLYLKKMLFRFGKAKSLVFSFTEETAIHLFSRCTLAQNIWPQTQTFLLNYLIIPNLTPQSAILGFLGGLHDEHNILINRILLIYKC